jgi:hypothetical protein
MCLVIHAILHLVDHSLNVEISMDHLHALVCLHISDPLQIVVRNVQSILSALATKLAYKRNVEIHVSDLAVSMRFALLSITHQFARAQKEILEIRSQTVMPSPLHVRTFSVFQVVQSQFMHLYFLT